MKVVCESCQAKYRVDDERVAGKKLKIRCRKCGSMILVRGDALVADAGLVAGAPIAGPRAGGPESVHEVSSLVDGSAQAADVVAMGSAEALSAPAPAGTVDGESYDWHVSIDGDEYGPMDDASLVAWLVEHPTAWDAHVWRDGFGDWVQARYIDSLIDAAIALIGSDAVESALAAEPQQLDMAQQAVIVDMSQGDAQVAVAGGGAGSPVAYSGGTADPRGAAPNSSPRLAAVPALTAARNEESVLFSMEGLRKAARSSSTPHLTMGQPTSMSAGAGTAPGYAAADGSGIIDIQALSALARSANESAQPEASDPADDPLLGGSIAFANLDSLAPVSMPEASSRRGGPTLPVAIMSGSVILAAALVAVAAIVGTSPEAAEQEAPVAASMAIPSQIPSEVPNVQLSAPTPVEIQPAAPEVAPATPDVAATDEQAEPAVAAGRSDSRRRSAARMRRRKARNNEGSVSKPEASAGSSAAGQDKTADKAGDLDDLLVAAPSQPKESQQAAATEKVPEEGESASIEDLMAGPAPKAKEPPKNRSIDDLLDVAVAHPSGAKAASSANKGPASPAGTATGSTLAAQPSRDQVLSAMRAITPSIQRCGSQNSATGVAKVKFTIQSSGSVSQTEVSGVSGPAAGCIAGAAKSAKFSPFQKPVFSVTFPFRL